MAAAAVVAAVAVAAAAVVMWHLPANHWSINSGFRAPTLLSTTSGEGGGDQFLRHQYPASRAGWQKIIRLVSIALTLFFAPSIHMDP